MVEQANLCTVTTASLQSQVFSVPIHIGEAIKDTLDNTKSKSLMIPISLSLRSLQTDNVKQSNLAICTNWRRKSPLHSPDQRANNKTVKSLTDNLRQQTSRIPIKEIHSACGTFGDTFGRDCLSLQALRWLPVCQLYCKSCTYPKITHIE